MRSWCHGDRPEPESSRNPLRGEDAIGLRVGRVIGHFHS